MRYLLLLISLIASLTLSGCGYNAMQAQDEQIKASWAEVLNQYQRRAVLEGFQRLQAIQLAFVAVNRVGGNAGALQFASELVGFDLGAGKNKNLIVFRRLEQFDQ